MNLVKTRLNFNSDGLSLEAVLHSLDTTRPVPGVVLCHPHPLYGGNMNNTVIHYIIEELNRQGIIGLRFNFRGVGASQGAYAEGEGETNDALAAVRFLRTLPNVDPARIGIAGYSFGAFVALRAAVVDAEIATVAAVSPPVDHFDLSFFLNYTRPKMLISGAEDELVDPKRFTDFAEKVAEPKVWELVPNADHFWGGLDPWLGSKVAGFFARTFNPAALQR